MGKAVLIEPELGTILFLYLHRDKGMLSHKTPIDSHLMPYQPDGGYH